MITSHINVTNTNEVELCTETGARLTFCGKILMIPGSTKAAAPKWEYRPQGVELTKRFFFPSRSRAVESTIHYLEHCAAVLGIPLEG